MRTLVPALVLAAMSFSRGAFAQQPPVADAGPDENVEIEQSVTLDASGSSDPDGDALEYDWLLLSAPGGSAASLSGATTDSPNVTPDLAGTYRIELTVSDGTDTDTDEVEVLARNPGDPAPTPTPGGNGQNAGDYPHHSGACDVSGLDAEAPGTLALLLALVSLRIRRRRV